MMLLVVAVNVVLLALVVVLLSLVVALLALVGGLRLWLHFVFVLLVVQLSSLWIKLLIIGCLLLYLAGFTEHVLMTWVMVVL